MSTRIVFGAGTHVEVALDAEQVREALQRGSQDGRLSEFGLTERDRDGNPIPVYVNPDHVAFVMGLEPPEEVPQRRDVRREPVVDLWGNPIKPRRGNR